MLVLFVENLNYMYIMLRKLFCSKERFILFINQFYSGQYYYLVQVLDDEEVRYMKYYQEFDFWESQHGITYQLYSKSTAKKLKKCLEIRFKTCKFLIRET